VLNISWGTPPPLVQKIISFLTISRHRYQPTRPDVLEKIIKVCQLTITMLASEIVIKEGRSAC
jgi:hypothetical protein